MENQESQLDQSQQTRTYWHTLSANEQAFVAAYVENGYSLIEASEVTGIALPAVRKYLNREEVKKAITELQNELDGIDFLNEKWVKTQLLKLYPKVIGEEKVPYVNNLGEESEVKKFHPDIAMRILEYIVPKDKDKDKEKENTSFSFSVTLAKDNGAPGN